MKHASILEPLNILLRIFKNRLRDHAAWRIGNVISFSIKRDQLNAQSAQRFLMLKSIHRRKYWIDVIHFEKANLSIVTINLTTQGN